MRKLLRLEDYLRLGFSFGVDLFEDVADAGGLMSFSYKQVYGFMPKKYRKSYLYKKVHQLLKTGQIEKIVKNGEPFFRLTNSGRKEIVRDFPILSMQQKKWDKKWRLVIFDIPEKKRKARDALREKLLKLGFGKWQRSIYISPHNFSQDLREFLKNRGLVDKAFVLEANVFSLIEARILAEKVWPLEKINSQYQKIIDQWVGREGKDEAELKRKIKDQYLKILTIDPLLPQELLPKDWLGEKVRRLVKKL
ncbi:CRISPR-associated endonuclease Cas2 [Candidatus Microgenomates bacterium]|nr:CRISPR-associated endonuclease Cas2 [Candidatus Microgenomates bacterium]